MRIKITVTIPELNVTAIQYMEVADHLNEKQVKDAINERYFDEMTIGVEWEEVKDAEF